MEIIKVNMPVTTLNTATKKREPVGAVDIYVPTLASLGIKTDQLIDAEKKPVYTDDGLPVYSDDTHNFVQDAIYAQVKAQARNRLVSGTATLKAGAKIATTWEELTEEIERTGGGAGLALYQELKTKFTAWVNSLAKSAPAKTLIITLFSNKTGLATQSADNKAKMAGYLGEFASTLSAEDAEKFSKQLLSLEEICNTSAEALDF